MFLPLISQMSRNQALALKRLFCVCLNFTKFVIPVGGLQTTGLAKHRLVTHDVSTDASGRPIKFCPQSRYMPTNIFWGVWVSFTEAAPKITIKHMGIGKRSFGKGVLSTRSFSRDSRDSCSNKTPFCNNPFLRSRI